MISILFSSSAISCSAIASASNLIGFLNLTFQILLVAFLFLDYWWPIQNYNVNFVKHNFFLLVGINAWL